MSGNLFTSHQPRLVLTTKDVSLFSRLIIERIKQHIHNSILFAECTIQPSSKDIHGDIDIVVDEKMHLPLQNLTDINSGDTKLSIAGYLETGNILNLCYSYTSSDTHLGYFNVDIMREPVPEFSHMYHSNAPRGIIAGMIAKDIYGLKLTKDGLVIPNIYGSTESIIYPADWKAVLGLLGIDNPHRTQYKNYNELYEELYNTPLFDKIPMTEAFIEKNYTKSTAMVNFYKYVHKQRINEPTEVTVSRYISSMVAGADERVSRSVETVRRTISLYRPKEAELEFIQRARDRMYKEIHLGFYPLMRSFTNLTGITDNLEMHYKNIIGMLKIKTGYTPELYSKCIECFYKPSGYDYLVRHACRFMTKEELLELCGEYYRESICADKT